MLKNLFLTILSIFIFSLPASADHWDDVLKDDYDRSGRYFNRYTCRSYYNGIPDYRGRGELRQQGICRERYQHPLQQEACSLGQQAAMVGAVFRISPQAIHDGITDGFDCGVEEGVNIGDSNANYRRAYNDLPLSLEDEILKDLTGVMRKETQAPAESTGRNMAANEVVSRFRKAITADGGKLPSRAPGNPSHGFRGVDNGYSLNGRYVESPDEILDSLYRDDYLDLYDFYDNRYDRDFGWGVDRHRYRYGKERRRRAGHGYHHEDSPYDRIWLRIARNRDKPERIRHIVRRWRQLSDEPIVVERKEEYQPPAGEDGVLPPKETRIVKDQLPSQREVFSQIFARMWDHSVHRAYYRIYERNLDRGFEMGLPLGEEAGQIYAEQKGTRDAYNELFKEESIDMFSRYFAPVYQTAFETNYSKLENSSSLESLSSNAIGEVADGAFMEGENVSFNFVLQNKGGKETSFEVMAQELTLGESGGNVSSSTREYDIKGLQRKSYTTEAFYTLPSEVIGLDQRKTQITVSLKAGGLLDSNVLTIFKPAGFENNGPSSSLQQAELYLPVTIYNPKNITSLEPVTIRMIVNGQVVQERNLGMMPAGEQSLTFVMTQDFFEMLGKSYNFKVELDYAGETIQARENMQVFIDRKKALIEYFDYLVLSKNAKLPKGVKHSDYVERYLNEVTILNREEMQAVADAYKPADSSSDRRDVKKRLKPKYELDRRDRLEHSDASIMLQLYKKRPYNDSSRDLKKKLDSKVREVFEKLAAKNWGVILRIDQQFGSRGDERHQRDYFRNTICAAAQVMHAFSNNKRRQDADQISIKAKLDGEKISFDCTVD